MPKKAKSTKERGMALLVALFAMLLISAIGLFMVLASNTETHIDANYSNSLRSYYAARSGLEEIRDRIKYSSTSTTGPGGLADLLPQDIAGNTGGVLYVLNPANGETVDPTDITSPYFDDQLCHDFNSGVMGKDGKCAVQPTIANWNLPNQNSIASSVQLNYKWIRINMKTNRIADPYFVDQAGTSATLDTRVCWDGQTEQLSPGGTTPSCDVNGMQTVYMLTSLAATQQTGGPNGSRKLLRLEVVAPSIRPAGVVTIGASGTAPLLSNSAGIPSIALDGRAHDINGNLVPLPGSSPTAPATATANSCSAIAPLATDSAAGTAQLEASLNLVRQGIVAQANNACNPDGTTNASSPTGGICTYGLWWVRGTDPLPRFITGGIGSTPGGSTTTTTTTTATSTISSSSTSGSTPGGSGSSGGRGGRDDDDSHGGHHHSDPTGAPDPSGACDSSNPACFTNLDLAAPELFASNAVTSTSIPIATTLSDSIAPFTGGKGNQSDASVYQPASANIVNNEIAAINKFALASVNDPNYFTASSATLASSYGTSTSPAVVNFTDQTLSLQGAASLTGFGVLIIPSALEISNSGTLNWTGIVVVQSPTGHVTINSGANGFINGALLVQPGAALSLLNSAPSATCGTRQQCTAFRITYSCDAIDLPFGSKPFKIISTAESSF